MNFFTTYFSDQYASISDGIGYISTHFYVPVLPTGVFAQTVSADMQSLVPLLGGIISVVAGVDLIPYILRKFIW